MLVITKTMFQEYASQAVKKVDFTKGVQIWSFALRYDPVEGTVIFVYKKSKTLQICDLRYFIQKRSLYNLYK